MLHALEKTSTGSDVSSLDVTHSAYCYHSLVRKATSFMSFYERYPKTHWVIINEGRMTGKARHLGAQSRWIHGHVRGVEQNMMRHRRV